MSIHSFLQNLGTWLYGVCVIGLIIVSPAVKAQGWIQEGAHLQNDSAFLVIEGSNTHFTALGNAHIGMRGTAEISLQGDWVNNSSSVLFLGNEGKVRMNGGDQLIGGSHSTSFPGLEAEGFGVKTLQVQTLVGGGYGQGSGQLSLTGGAVLNLNSQKLIINNPDTGAIRTSAGMGYILGETGPVPGYGELEWAIRDAPLGSSYRIPLGTNLYFRFDVQNGGIQVADSGFLRLSTYPTNALPSPNNRPFPNGVMNSNNLFGAESSLSMIDRYWMLGSGGYTSNPALRFFFKYDQEHLGSNDIDPASLGAIRWDAAGLRWLYPGQGTPHVSGAFVQVDAGRSFEGIYTLSDTIYCPTAAFRTGMACAQAGTAFTDLSTLRKGSIQSRNWDFGNGSCSSDSLPETMYSSAGTYHVKLVVTADNGCRDSAEQIVEVFPSPLADFSAVDTCSNQWTEFRFTGSGTSINWRFSDGQSDTGVLVNKRFSQAGTYSVTLIVGNTAGCADTLQGNAIIVQAPEARFSVGAVCEGDSSRFVNLSQSSAGSLSAYRWLIGNFAENNDFEPVVEAGGPGTYPVVLMVSNSLGCWDTAVGNATVYPAVVAAFDYYPAAPVMRQEILFNDLSTGADRWDWDFGNGTGDRIQNPVHSYQRYGEYTVRLRVYNRFGCSDSSVLLLRIGDAVPYWIPSAFTPGGRDELNTDFGLHTPGEIHSYHLRIYSRWGELLFESRDVNERWKGTYRGVDVQAGSYLYTISFRDVNYRAFHYAGEVLLLR